MMKKHITPMEAERILCDVPEEKHFKLKIGAKIANIKELHEMLEIISDRNFMQHVTKNRNDFANWIRNVVYDSELADMMQKADTRKKALYVLCSRIDMLESRKRHGIPLYSHEWMIFGCRDFLVGLIIGIIIGYLLYYITLVWAF